MENAKVEMKRWKCQDENAKVDVLKRKEKMEMPKQKCKDGKFKTKMPRRKLCQVRNAKTKMLRQNCITQSDAKDLENKVND